MNQAKVRLVILFLVLIIPAGCGGYHQGRPGSPGESTAQEVVPEVKQLVEQNVKDPDKARQVQAMIQDIVKEVRTSAQAVRGFHEQLAVVNANYDAKPEEFTKILDALNNTRMESAAKILQTRFKIKEMTTPEEWKNLNDAMMKSRREHERHLSPGDMHRGGSPSGSY